MEHKNGIRECLNNLIKARREKLNKLGINGKINNKLELSPNKTVIKYI